MKNILKDYRPVIFYTIIGVIIGILVGAIDALFGRVLIAISAFRGEHVFLLVPFLALAGLLILFLYQKFSPDAQKGMTLIFEAGFEETREIPKALIPLVMICTWITHLFGGSAGREGVAVQIGATLSHSIGNALGKTRLGDFLIHPDELEKVTGSMMTKKHAMKHPKRLSIVSEKDNGKVFLVVGMAAGFGGLFQTPLAATFFALEVLVSGAFFYEAMLPAVTAAFTASFTSHLLGLEKFSVQVNDTLTYNVSTIARLILIAVIFGIVGGAFSHFLALGKKYLKQWIANPYKRIFIIGVILSVFLLILFKGRYCGLGTNLISASFTGEKVYGFDFILKFILTILTLSAGFQGGEVTPLFSIGATLGVLLASVFGLPVMLVAGLGYAAVFGSATNTLVAPIFVGIEVFGAEHAIPFAIVCIIAFACNNNQTIYGKQRLSKMLDYK